MRWARPAAPGRALGGMRHDTTERPRGTRAALASKISQTTVGWGMLQSPRPSDLGSEADEVHAGLQPSTIIYQGKKGYKMVRQYLMGDMLGEGAQGKVKEAGALSHLSLGRCSALP
jgi:hypothetical protein